MGIYCSSELYRGHISSEKTVIMKLILLTIFVAAAFAEEAVEEAKPEAPKAVVPVHAVHPFHGLWGHQLQWPGIRAPGFSATCFGCRGKRSAVEAAPVEEDARVFGLGHNSYVGRTVWGFPLTKRSAEEVAPAEVADCVFGLGHNSCVGRTVWGFPRGKRSAEPGYYHPYGLYGYPYHFGYHALKPLKSGTAVHPGHATSFVERSPQGAKA